MLSKSIALGGFTGILNSVPKDFSNLQQSHSIFLTVFP